MKKALSIVLSVLLILLPLCTAAAEGRAVLTIGDTLDRSGARVDGEDQLGIWRYLEDQLGVEIEYVYMDPDDYTAALTSGNLPDIVIAGNKLAEIRENGLALNAEPYLEKYVPNLLKGDVGLTYELFKRIMSDGDGFYFFPEQIGSSGIGYSNEPFNRGYVVRWDYYKELGYPPINDEDDYLDVLRQMHANHPYTEEGYPTYLYGTNNHSGYSTAFWRKVSLNYWVAYKYQNDIFTNEVFDGYTDPEHSMWWTGMAWYNKLYRAGKDDGSFDMDIFSQTREQHEVKCARGQYMGLHQGKASFYDESIKKDPDTMAGYGTVPSGGANLYTNVYQIMGNGSAFMWFISANSPQWEAALKLINYMCDPDFLRDAAMGQRGVTWDHDADGVPRMTEYGREQLDAYRAGKATQDNYFYQWGTYSGLTSRWPLLRNNMPHPDGYALDFTLSRDHAIAAMTNNISKDICERYGVELPTDAFYQAGALDFRNDCGEAISSCISSLDRDQLNTLTDAESILESVWIDLVLAETDAAFDAIRDETIRKLNDLGEPEVFREFKQKWDAAAAVIVPLVREAQVERGITPYTPERYGGRS